MYGREPRTALSAKADWSANNYGEQLWGLEGVTHNDVNEIIAIHHARMDAVQQLIGGTSSLAQAVTKKKWEEGRVPVRLSVGEYVLVHVTAPNRLLPWNIGPYKIVSISACGNFVHGVLFVDPAAVVAGPFHVSRLRLVDMSRVSKDEVASFQLEAGSAIVGLVLGHRMLADGSMEYHIQWFESAITTWLPSQGLRKVSKVLEYCLVNGLPPPGTELVTTQPAVAVKAKQVRLRVGRGK